MIDVACGIVLKNDKILVAQRSEKMSLPLKWEFPGGKVEPLESAENCLKRELFEELNIEIKILQHLTPKQFDYKNFSINLIPFLSEFICGEVILREHKNYMWLKREFLNSLDWANADLPILDEFLKLKL